MDRGMFLPLQSRALGSLERCKLYNVSKDNLDFIQRLKVDRKLEVHNGCVNTICWNDCGQSILSGSDDQFLVISDPFLGKKRFTIRSGHRANIFSAKFMPNSQDKQVVSCSGDGKIFFTEVECEDTYGTNCFDCHFGTTYEVIVVPNETSTFMSCGEDGTVRLFDLRMKTRCAKEDCKDDILVNCRRAVTSLAVNPTLPYQLGIACSDSSVRIFDRRMLGTRVSGNYTGRGITGMLCRFTAPSLEGRSYRITSLCYSPDGEEMLVSYSSEHIYLFSTKDERKLKALKMATSTSLSNSQVEGATGVTILPADGSSNDSTNRQPPIKRLRLRGDWSDTGPNARPERERQTGEDRRSPHTTIMQRMSDMLTRWLDGSLRNEDERPAPAAGENRSNVNEAASFSGGHQSGGAERSESEIATASTPAASATENKNDAPVALSPTGACSEPSTTKTEAFQPDESPSEPSSESSAMKEATAMPVPPSKVRNLRPKSLSSFEECSITSFPSTSSTDEPMTTPSDRSFSTPDVISSSYKSSISSVDLEARTCSMVPEVESMQENNLVTLPPQEAGACDEIRDFQSSHGNEPGSAPEVPSSASIDNECVQSLSSNISVEEDNSGTRSAVLSVSHSENNLESMAFSDFEQSHRSFEAPVRVEPVISLHYVTEGTSSSTIRVGFATFENLEAGILERSAENASLNQLGTSGVPGQLGLSASEGPHTAMEVDRSSHGEETLTRGGKSEASTDRNRPSSSPSSLSAKKLTDSEKAKRLEEKMELCESELSVQTDNGQHEEDASTNLTKSGGATSGSVSTLSATSGFEQKVEPVTSPQGALSADGVDLNSLTANIENCDTSEGMVTFAESSAEEKEKGSKLSSSQANPGERSVSDSGVRQRRVGRSGPPTGNFNPEDDSSDDELLFRPNRLRNSQWDDQNNDLERNVAAIRLQELYRRKQEEREKEEREMMNVYQPSIKIKYKGHRNARTMIKEANFWGDHFVMSGSDCGHIFFWDRYTAKLVMLLEADKHVVNCLQPHPFDPILASSGIDYDIKIWQPLEEKPNFDEVKAEEIIRRNEIMLEETRDTITVPAAFMLRVLASLNQIRAGRASSRDDQVERDSESDSD